MNFNKGSQLPNSSIENDMTVANCSPLNTEALDNFDFQVTFIYFNILGPDMTVPDISDKYKAVLIKPNHITVFMLVTKKYTNQRMDDGNKLRKTNVTCDVDSSRRTYYNINFCRDIHLWVEID